jgi:hypothetical protein
VAGAIIEGGAGDGGGWGAESQGGRLRAIGDCIEEEPNRDSEPSPKCHSKKNKVGTKFRHVGSDAHDFDGITDHVGGAVLAFRPSGRYVCPKSIATLLFGAADRRS